MIRTAVASLTIFLSITAAAQAVSSVEQSYGPYLRPSTGYDPALAVSNDAVLLAWSEVMPSGLTQIRIGLLDFHGRLVSQISTIDSTIDAKSPAVFYDGDSFRVEYVEGRARLSVDVDFGGTPIGLPQLPLPRAPILTAQVAPPVCFGRPCVGIYNWVLSWSGPGGSGSYLYAGGGSVQGPVAGAHHGNHILLVWYSPNGVWFAYIFGTVRNIARLPAEVNVHELPAVGCDDTHCLIAFTTKSRQIHGMLIDQTQPWLSTPVPIETQSLVERPQVHVLHNGRFLVAYVSAANAPTTRFAGRIVTTAPIPRRRAVR